MSALALAHVLTPAKVPPRHHLRYLMAMGRKLKTYMTSAGFYDLAVAAPSMKAALAAWESRSNLFQHGFARETEEAAIVAATMARPGVVLRRPVGSREAFSEHPGLPTLPQVEGTTARAAKAAATEAPASRRKAGRQATSAVEPPAAARAAAERKAAQAFEREQARRERQRQREEAEGDKRRRRREQAVAAAESALAAACGAHDRRRAEIEAARAALHQRATAEEESWQKERARLEAALRTAREAD